ncbi:immunoglobulin-like domain-containing protein [Listeria booriae]|uniref:immunoglobulin-like domain-containing protein n=1 Tax=Listeria booriae TaxID=1552123 RepID=UPI001627DD4C|nr:immunoglobulin-like domain-containing protein [Listeria booriae]MBC2319896.1 DUF5011 domain-containing protein [Listeria booriae]
MNIKKIGIATTALLLCANLPMQTHAMAAESKQVYATKAESKLKSSQAEGQGSFSDVTDYFSVVPGKSSSIDKNNVIITPDANQQVGGLWSDPVNKVDLTKNFHLEANLYMGANANGADGMAFVMQNDSRGNSALGQAGGGLGVYGPSFIHNALAVEFDTYYNQGMDRDVVPNREHMAITIPSADTSITHRALNILPEGVHFADGMEHQVIFDWDAATKTLSYSYQGYTGSYQVQDLQAAFGGSEVIFGFTGSTGSEKNLQKLTITELQINGISPKLELEINDKKGNNNGKAEPSETVSVKNTISNTTDDATAFKMEYGVDMDALFDADTVSNIVLTRNDGQTYTVTKEQLLSHQVELPFDSPTNTFTLTYDVQVKADASPKGTMMNVSGIGKVNGVKYTSENSITLAIPGDSPVITASDKTLKKGGSFDPMAGVSASDTEDGNITDNVTVTANDVNTSAVGTYHVTYSVTDSDGNTTTKTITVTVTSNDAPVITASDKTLKKGGSFDPMAGVSASDTEDGNVTDKVTVTANDVDTSAVGTYHVTYSVTDSDGNTTTKTITVTVTSNDAPVIVASDQTIKKGKAFDVMAGVSASDLEDGDVTGGITVTANDVDTNTVGTYHVTYSVTDSDGNTTTKTITVTITSNDAPTFMTSDVYLKVGDTFNPYAGITASDTEDGDLTDRIDIDSSNVDMTQPGTYAVEYSVTDSDNNTTKITRHVYVRTNDKPVIHASDQTFKAGASFDPFAGMSASDTEDGDITANVTITANDVDANQAGTYHVTYSVTDSDANTTTKTVTITVLTNEKPVIPAADITQKAHRSVDPMAGVTASDLEDGDLTANIKIIANDINIDVPGEYHVTYSVLDSDGNETEKTITVTILSNDAPVIHGQDVTFKAGKAFDPLAGVTASDTEDGDITSTIKVTANDVNPDVAGVYHVTYSVTDSDGNTTEVTYTVTVLTNEKPVIHATDQTLAYGQAFDPMAGVTAEDFEDGDLTGSIKIISNDVNPLQAGIYHVTYSVTDADGNETQITITVLVGAQPVDPVIPADPETPMHVTPAPVQTADPIVSSVSDPVQELPKTGDTTTGNTILFGGLFAALGAFLLRRKK